MPIHIPAEATCDHCGKTTPCKLACALPQQGGASWGDHRDFEQVCVAIRGLGAWFWRDDGVACSEACKAALANEPRYKKFGGQWRSFG